MLMIIMIMITINVREKYNIQLTFYYLYVLRIFYFCYSRYLKLFIFFVQIRDWAVPSHTFFFSDSCNVVTSINYMQ